MEQIQTNIKGERERVVSLRVDAYRRRFAETHLENLAQTMHVEGTTFEEALGKATSMIHSVEIAGFKVTKELYEITSGRLNALVHEFVDKAAQSAEHFVTLAEKLDYMDKINQFAETAMSLISEWEQSMVPHLEAQTIN